MNRNFLATFIFCILLTAFACVLAVHDHLNGLNSLALLVPSVNFLSGWGAPFLSQGHITFSYSCAALGTLLFLLMLTLPLGSRWLVMLGLVCALTGQLLFVDRHFWQFEFLPTALLNRVDLAIPLGASLYGVAVLFWFVALRREAYGEIYEQGKSQSQSFSSIDVGIFSLCFLAAVVLRVYAINYIVNSFDGELSPYSAGATSLRGMWYANRGYHGPWAPLGMLYYPPIYLTTSLFGTNLVSLRLSSAIVGLLTIPFVYMLAARLGGKTAGHIAAALFTLNTLHIGWSRTDVHPHGVTTWPTLLMCYFLLKAYDTRKIVWAIGVAIMMGLSWHQYPSGQSAVGIPLVAAAIFFLVNRFTFPLSWKHLTILCGGLALWFLGLPFERYMVNRQFVFSNPFNLTGPRALWGGGEAPQSSLQLALFTAQQALLHLRDVFQGLFYKVPYLFHQEWLPYSWDITSRTVGWIEMPLVALGGLLLLVAIKRFESAVLLGWLVVALLPGILSAQAYPKRLSTLYPALDIIAALGFTALLYTVSNGSRRWRRYPLQITALVTLACAFCFQIHIWFSGKFWRYGEPFEVRLANESSSLITPHTLAVVFVGGGYEVGKFTYLWLDHIASPANRPNLVYFASHSEIETLTQTPLKASQRLYRNWAYIWTKMRDQLDETLQNKDWKRVVFFIGDFRDEKNPAEPIVQQAMSACRNPTKREFIPEPSSVAGNPLDIIAVSCQIEDLTTPPQ
jgi:hypothetical protein